MDVYIQYSLAVTDSFDTLSRLIALQQVSNESKLITAGTRQNVFPQKFGCMRCALKHSLIHFVTQELRSPH